MGSCASKAQVAVTTTPVKANIELKGKEDLTIDQDVLMDPRSPDIHRTPLTDVLGNRLNYRDRIAEQLPHTPINSLRSKLLNLTLNDKKLLDPRSPSQFIPRTPLNLSFDDTSKLEGNIQLYSIEYNGNIEDESCRNFYERLANITLDDVDTEAATNITTMPKNGLDEIREEDQFDVKSLSEEDIQILSAELRESLIESESRPHTPITQIPSASTLKFTENLEMDGENIVSPIVNNAILSNKKSNIPISTSAFSSTPIVAPNNGELKKLLLKTHLKKVYKPDIFEDDEVIEENGNTDSIVIMDGNRSEDEILTTPIKRMNKDDGDDKQRTPLSVLNRRSRSVESLLQRQSKLNQTKNEIENNIGGDQSNQLSTKLNNDENIFYTPQPKQKTLRQRNGALRPRVTIFND